MTATQERVELTRLREQIARVEVEISTIESGYLTVEEATTRLVTAMHARVEGARTRLAYFTAPGGNPHFESVAEMKAIVELVADPAAFEKSVRAAFAQIVPKGAMSLHSRPAAMKPLQDKRRELLLLEEREICRLERDGLAVVRREGIDAERAAVMLEAWDAA
jgi:hypothetical protein